MAKRSSWTGQWQIVARIELSLLIPSIYSKFLSNTVQEQLVKYSLGTLHMLFNSLCVCVCVFQSHFIVGVCKAGKGLMSVQSSGIYVVCLVNIAYCIATVLFLYYCSVLCFAF